MAIIVNTDSFRDRAPTGAELIAAERTRQIEQEGFSHLPARESAYSCAAKVLICCAMLFPDANSNPRVFAGF